MVELELIPFCVSCSHIVKLLVSHLYFHFYGTSHLVVLAIEYLVRKPSTTLFPTRLSSMICLFDTPTLRSHNHTSLDHFQIRFSCGENTLLDYSAIFVDLVVVY